MRRLYQIISELLEAHAMIYASMDTKILLKRSQVFQEVEERNFLLI
uniref:Uncharacterized protein n=1 Tax=Arundo donax TaxID=35708 RepID=A0A0A9D937_ARUDO